MADLTISFGKTVQEFIKAVVNGPAREIACFGTRGDGKTIGALFAMLAHAQVHRDNGFPLPAKWLGATDTFESHKEKTFDSMRNPLWGGIWKSSEGGHIWTAGGLVELHLFGVKDKSETDRLRAETVGLWFEEPAPAAVLVKSSGIDETGWTTGITSQRMPTYRKCAIMTLNYPDEDHWTWQRFIENPQPGTQYFRVPPGERASESDRREWDAALTNRPDLKRRLLQGLPGTVRMGPEVAQGFNEDLHVAKSRIAPIHGEPLFIGADFGHTPTVVIGQSWQGFIRVYCGLTIERGGVKQLVEGVIRPWLMANARNHFNEHLIVGSYDPAAADEQTDIEQNPAELLRQLVPGYWTPGPVDWDSRKGPMLAAMNKAVAGYPALQLDPVGCKELIRALSSRWYYPEDKLAISRDRPKKPNHPWEDYGDAFCYMLCGMGVNAGVDPKPRPIEVHTNFDARNQPTTLRVQSNFDARR